MLASNLHVVVGALLAVLLGVAVRQSTPSATGTCRATCCQWWGYGWAPGIMRRFVLGPISTATVAAPQRSAAAVCAAAAVRLL